MPRPALHRALAVRMLGRRAIAPRALAVHAPSVRTLLIAAGLASLLAALPAQAQQRVTFGGRMGERALLVIDGQPRVLAVGATSAGVRLVALDAAQALVDVGGERRTLVLTGGRAGAAGPPTAIGGEIVLVAGPGGHFTTPGLINGRPVSLMVDTGATIVAMSQDTAARIGIDYRRGQRLLSRTANGIVESHLVTLDTVRIGDVQLVNVQAAVLPATMDQVLLGNSFLSRFQMRRDNEVMRLLQR